MNKNLKSIDANDVFALYGSSELEKQIEKFIISDSSNLAEKCIINYDNKLAYILDKITSNLDRIEFIDVLLSEYDDDLNRYTQRSGFINIPKSLVAVVVIDKILQKAELLNINICKKNNESYIYNGKFWEKFELDVLKKFLHQS